MAELDLNPAVASLLAPVESGVRTAVASLAGPHLRVTLAPLDGLYRVEPGVIVLSDALAGPDLHHPADVGSLLAIDRWRRAAASVVEGAVLAGLGEPADADWRWTGYAIWRAATLYPELQVALSDLALARHTGAPGTHPRAGYAVFRALEREGRDPAKLVQAWRGGAVVEPKAFLAWGRWALATNGGQAELPVPVPRCPDRDIPLTLPPYTWQPLRVPANPRGGRITVSGPGAVHDAWGIHDQPLQTLAASTHAEVRLAAESGGPLGAWVLRSADGFGQVMGSRGFTFEFAANGVASFVLADAFVGPIAALEMAERVGTSGIVRGRWRVAGPHQIVLSGLDTTALTMHGHQDAFAVPAQGLGLAQSIQAMSGHPWTWRIEGDRLWLTGNLQGSPIEVRLDRT